MHRNRKQFSILFFLFLFSFLPLQTKAAQETEREINQLTEELGIDFEFEEIQTVIDEVLADKEGISFSNLIKQFVTGKKTFSFETIIAEIKDSVIKEIRGNLGSFKMLLSIALIGAIFTNFSNIFGNRQVAETSFYITYLLLFTTLITTFTVASMLVKSTTSAVLDFMKALLPTYFLSIAFCSGQATSLVFYEAALLLISGVNIVIIHVVIPLIHIYVILSLADHLSEEEHLSKLAEFVLTLTNWLLKSMFGVVIGFHTIQGILVPVVDSVKNSLLYKAANAVPVIGNTIQSVTETVFGVGVLLKNAIGVVGMIVLITICFFPMIKLVIYSLLYELGGAIVQPIADKRMIQCIQDTGKGVKLLLYTMLLVIVLFLLTIVIVAVSTNFKL